MAPANRSACAALCSLELKTIWYFTEPESNPNHNQVLVISKIQSYCQIDMLVILNCNNPIFLFFRGALLPHNLDTVQIDVAPGRCIFFWLPKYVTRRGQEIICNFAHQGDNLLSIVQLTNLFWHESVEKCLWFQSPEVLSLCYWCVINFRKVLPGQRIAAAAPAEACPCSSSAVTGATLGPSSSWKTPTTQPPPSSCCRWHCPAQRCCNRGENILSVFKVKQKEHV